MGYEIDAVVFVSSGDHSEDVDAYSAGAITTRRWARLALARIAPGLNRSVRMAQERKENVVLIEVGADHCAFRVDGNRPGQGELPGTSNVEKSPSCERTKP